MHNSNHSQPLPEFTRRLADEDATLALGASLAPLLQPGMTLYLKGDLGAGKTTLARGVLRGIGYQGKVKSPTFTLVELYAISRLDCYHFDFYRLKDPTEWEDAGFREYFTSNSLCLVEWPEKAGGLLPPADLTLELVIEGTSRIVTLRADTETGNRCIRQLRAMTG